MNHYKLYIHGSSENVFVEQQKPKPSPARLAVFIKQSHASPSSNSQSPCLGVWWCLHLASTKLGMFWCSEMRRSFKVHTFDPNWYQSRRIQQSTPSALFYENPCSSSPTAVGGKSHAGAKLVCQCTNSTVSLGMSGHAILPKMPKPHGPVSIMNPDLLQVGQRAAKHLDTHRNCLGSRREELRLTYQDWRENPDGNKVELRWNKQGNGAENQKGWAERGVCREVRFKDLSLVHGFSNHPGLPPHLSFKLCTIEPEIWKLIVLTLTFLIGKFSAFKIAIYI